MIKRLMADTVVRTQKPQASSRELFFVGVTKKQKRKGN
jgi:hypothetical protein